MESVLSTVLEELPWTQGIKKPTSGEKRVMR